MRDLPIQFHANFRVDKLSKLYDEKGEHQP